MNQPHPLQSAAGLGWYLKRLQVMRPAELLHRVGERWALRRLRAGHGHFVPPPVEGLAFCTASSPRLPELPLDELEILAQQPSLLEGCWPALGFSWQWQPGARAWRRAPDTGQEWPDDFFAEIAYRPGNPYGDVRVVWEPARLQQLVSLAVVARRADPAAGASAVSLIEEELLSFTAANPPWSGVHYLSAMECALRMIAVLHAVDMVRDRLVRGSEVWAAVASLVSSHASLIAARLSLHSSAGNHTIAESAALVYAGCLFPELPRAARWRRRGLALLTAEMQRQVLADGGGIEQAFWYLLLIADLGGLVIALLDHCHQPVPERLQGSVDRARGFLSAFADRPAQLPHIGDRDDGFALTPALRISFSDAGHRPVAQTFPQSGYSVARMENAPHYDILFDHGPLGMPPSCGHGHADALSVCLRVAGRDVLIDPGTYTYTGDLQWRAYFRSTAAHNTVTVDGCDQAVQETAFMWSRGFRAELVRVEHTAGVFRALARHDGYTRLSRKVLHWRGVVLRSGCGLLVWDYLDGEGDHDVELRWLVREKPVESSGGWLLDADTLLTIQGAGIRTTLEASMSPPGGWWSSRYGTRRPGCTISAAVHGPTPVELITRVCPRGVNSPLQQLNEDLEQLRKWFRPQ